VFCEADAHMGRSITSLRQSRQAGATCGEATNAVCISIEHLRTTQACAMGNAIPNVQYPEGRPGESGCGLPSRL
jgi:hypothetical protein